MASGKFISYLRVSTQKQGISGLGLEAQRSAVAGFLNGGDWELVSEYVEIESGKRDDRPELARAVAAAKKAKATLILAKMDRLGRRASTVLNLLDNSGVEFRFVEMPHASKLEIGVRAVVAEEEGRAISQRTKAALAAAKARGKALGFANPNRSDVARATVNSVASRKSKADAFAANVLPIIESIRAAGVTTLRDIAAALNTRGIRTANGGEWYATTVKNVLARAA